jgi:hypothetical protein
MNNMTEYEKTFWQECPKCGAELIVTTECDPKDDKDGNELFNDGDYVRCAESCGFVSALNVDDSFIWLRD